MARATGRAGPRLGKLALCQLGRARGSLPVPSFGRPLAAPWLMTEFSEFSFLLSILAADAG